MVNCPETLQDGKHRALPGHFELRGVAGYSFPAFLTTMGAAVCRLADQLLENEWRRRGEVEARQLQQLRSLLQFAEQHCPFYSDRIRACGLNPGAMDNLEGFRRLPVLTRADLQDHFQQMKAVRLPPGTEVQGEISTSGSTAAPVRVLTTSVTSLMWGACSIRDLVWAGVNPRGSLASVRHFPEELRQARTEEGVNLTNWGGLMADCFASGPAYLMDISQDPEAQLNFLVEADADYLLSCPSNLDTLGRMLVERGLTLSSLKMIQTIDEVLPEHLRRSIESAFKAPVWDLYSSGEVGYIASQCPGGHGHHAHEENVLVEILDENNQPCEPRQPGKVVVTALLNYASPIIRYDVGDYATAMSDPCPCGRQLMGLEEIIGRQRGQLLLPDGRVKFNSGLSVALRDMGQIRQFKVIQHERDHYEVFIVPMENFGEQHRKSIIEEFHSYLGFPVRVSITLVPHIERTPGGKYLDFVCNAT